MHWKVQCLCAIVLIFFFFFSRYMCYVFTIGLLDLVIIQATSSLSRMAPLVAFRCCLIIMYNCSLFYVAENKLVVVVYEYKLLSNWIN